MRRLLLKIILLGVAFLIVTNLFPAHISLTGSPLSAFWAAIIFILLNLLVSPLVMILKIIAIPLTLLTLGLISLLISFAFNILIFWIMSYMGWGIDVKSSLALILGPLALSITTAILNLLVPAKARFGEQ